MLRRGKFSATSPCWSSQGCRSTCMGPSHISQISKFESILSSCKGLWDTVKQGRWNQVLLHIAVLIAWLWAVDHLCGMHKAGKLKNYEYHLF